MMKRMLLSTLVGVFCLSGNLSAINPYHSLRHHVVALGHGLDKVNLPLIGKLTGLLPFAMLATSFKECPGQTIILVSGLLVYALLQNESVQAALSGYNLPGFMGQSNNQTNATDADETLFVFEGEDVEDEFDAEDELLEEDLLAEEYAKKDNNRRQAESSVVKFL